MTGKSIPASRLNPYAEQPPSNPDRDSNELDRFIQFHQRKLKQK